MRTESTTAFDSENDVFKPYVIVVGDWVVDEYNFLVRKRSDVSSHVGQDHFAIADLGGNPTSKTTDLCGAGHVAKVLYKMFGLSKNRIHLLGIGVWNARDNDVIHHLLHECPACRAQVSLSRQMCPEKPGDRVTLGTLDPDAFTNRVARDYLQQPKGFALLTRRDFEAHAEPSPLKDSAFEAIGLPDPNGVVALVIHDLQKGVINEKTLKILADRYPQVPWYVRSKNSRFEWPSNLPSHSRRLFFLGPELASKFNPIGYWNPDRLTLPAFEILSKSATPTLVLTEERQVFARFGDSYLTGASTARLDEVAQVGWSSAVFAALVAKMIDRETWDPVNADQAYLLNEALKDAEEFVRARASVVGPASEPPGVEAGSPVGNTKRWVDEQDCWNLPKEGPPIIGIGPDAKLEVWRALSDLPDYLICIDEKRKRVRALAERLRTFRSTRTNLGVMLTADPGSGKSSLVRAIAKRFDFAMVEVDVAQMIDRTELIDMFDHIVSLQAERKTVLVFVDEVNAPLGGNPVYGTFLAPLQDGLFRRRGLSSILQPCVWVFAGTDFEKGEKAKDLATRINFRLELDYSSLKREAGAQLTVQAKREQCYLGALLIKRNHPEVKKIRRGVLQRFFAFNPEEPPAREIMRYVSALTNVKYGCVSLSNFPDEFRNTDGGTQIEDADLVEVRF